MALCVESSNSCTLTLNTLSPVLALVSLIFKVPAKWDESDSKTLSTLASLTVTVPSPRAENVPP